MRRFILLTLVITACSSPQNKMSKEIENFVTVNFHDPKSYEPISLEVIDTIFTVDSLRRIIRNDSIKIEYLKIDKYSDDNMSIEAKLAIADAERLVANALQDAGVKYNKTTKRDYDSEIKIIRDRMDSCYNEIHKIKSDKISVINCLHKYRAKNAVGALNLSEAFVVFNDSIKLLHFNKIEE